MARKSITKTLRFEVLKRDSFACQYCGAKAPEVVLHVDHIEPVSKGGTNELLNLITSCLSCNLGKSDRRLDDDSIIQKHRTQLEVLQERKEQLEMMMQWQKGLLSLESSTEDQAADFWTELVPPYCLTKDGRKELSKYLAKYPLSDVLDSMKAAVRQYVELQDGKPTLSSVKTAWEYVGRISNMKKADKEKPYLKDLLYVRGIVRNRCSYCNESRALELLEQAYESGSEIEDLKRLAKSVRNWSEWQNEMNELIEA